MQTNNFVPPSGITGGGRAYDYDGRDNQYGTHDSTISAPEAQTNQDRGRGQQTSSAPSRSSSYSSSRGSNFGGRFHGADGGRTGYFFGGRVNYKIGGRVGFKNGGLASIL